jgi:hypothetical protein
MIHYYFVVIYCLIKKDFLLMYYLQYKLIWRFLCLVLLLVRLLQPAWLM